MLYVHQSLLWLAKQPPTFPTSYQRAVALGLTLLVQAMIDQNDEAQPQTAPNELIRQAILLSILGSPRPNVLSDVVSQVTALGPGIVPHLIDILQGEHFWARPRALQVITELAQVNRGAVETVISVMLDLIDEAQSVYVLEAVEAALVAIGPAVIALANIPAPACANALLSYIASKQAMEEHEADVLADLGHPAAIPFLRDRFD